MKKRQAPFFIIAVIIVCMNGCKKADGPGFGPGTQPVQVVPSVSVTATPASVAFGGTSTVNWTTSNATTVTSSVGVNTTNGSVTLTNLMKDTTVTVTATSSTGNTAKADLKITVTPPPPKIVALIAHAWKPATAMFWSGTAWHDVLRSCEIDDIRTFLPDGKGIFKQGTDKCTPEFPDTMDFSWACSIDANGVITLTKWSVNNWTIEVCNDDLLVLSSKEATTEIRLTLVR